MPDSSDTCGHRKNDDIMHSYSYPLLALVVQTLDSVIHLIDHYR